MTTPPPARTAVIGDVGGHAEPFASLLTDLGADTGTGVLPEGLHIVQVGDLIHRGPGSAAVLDLVERFLTGSPGRWHQLIGNHEAQYLRPGGTTFSWPAEDTLSPTDADRLRSWWQDGLMNVAAHVPTDGPGTIVTHAGVTPGFALMAHQGVATGSVSAAEMVHTLNDLPRAHRDDLLWQEGLMLTGEVTPYAGPLWAEAAQELYTGWFWAQGAGPVPWDQVHGHANPVDFDRRAWWPISQLVADRCTVDLQRRHVTFRSYAGATITSIDPGHQGTPSPQWAPLVLDHA